MNLLITTPTLKVPHGGTRVINEWATRLSEFHNVTLLVNYGPLSCDWYDLPRSVKVTDKEYEVQKADCVVIGSPHAVNIQRLLRPNQKCFIFLQMLEHLFNPSNTKFQHQCHNLYKSKYPLISISQWNIDYLKSKMRRGKIHYVGNGVNLNHFPINTEGKENAVLIEGWECNNVSKDIDAIAPQVAAGLKQDGYKILAYSQHPLKHLSHIPDEYYCRPSLEKMNELYSRAKILLKASKYDARSTAPMEAMTKGTPTVRAIMNGDDDLINNVNCIRVPYGYVDVMYDKAKYLLDNDEIRQQMADRCVEHVQSYSWEYWISEINNILCKDD